MAGRKQNDPEYMAALSEIFEDNATGIMRILTNARKQSAVHTDEEIARRINDYFKSCMDCGVLPDLASLAISMGISKHTLEGWARGINCSADRQELVQSAYTTIESAQLQATTKGMFNPILFMFLAKSKYGYKEDGSVSGMGDRAVIEAGASNNEIADKYNHVYSVSLPSLEKHETLEEAVNTKTEVHVTADGSEG